MYYRTPARHPGRRRLVIATALVVIIIAIDWLSGGFLRAQVRMAGVSASRALAAAGAAVQDSGALNSKASLEATNHTLATQVASLTEEAANAQYLQQQNAQLQTLLNLAQNSSGFAAPIVSAPAASPYGTFAIGLDASQHVSKGDLVLTQGGFVVGEITDVGGGTALVSELFAPQSSVQAQLDGAAVTIAGQGGGNGSADVPRGLSVSIGDIATSPQFGQRPIGIVGAVASSSAGAAQTVYLRLPQALSALQYVYVTTRSQ